MNFRMFSLFILSMLFVAQIALAQSVKWKPKKIQSTPLQLFHSTYALSLPTAETLQKGDWEFEISHRFVPPISEGEAAFFGLDGPVNNRIALGYAINNNHLITLARSNVFGQYDLWAKYRFVQLRNQVLPVVAALRIGGAWNTKVAGRDKTDSKNFQFYSQIVLNSMWQKKIAGGLAISFLQNSAIFQDEVKTSLLFGYYFQYYLSPMASVLLEWNPTFYGWRDSYNSLSFGFELETGGHFFKMYATNNDLLQPAQFLVGANRPVGLKHLRFGFMITRVLKLGM